MQSLDNFESAIELATESDRFYDYCLWEYKPPVSWAGKLKSANLLLHSLHLSGVAEPLRLVNALRDALGAGKTVWGLKRKGLDLAWEFYFYDYRRRERKSSITRVLEALRPQVGCWLNDNEALPKIERLPYFMFSLDVDCKLLAGQRNIEELHVYIGNPGSMVSSGICYSLRQSGTSLENFYFFFDAEKQREDIMAKIACSSLVDFSAVNMKKVLWPELADCGVIVAANKQACDGVYFSRINLEQFLIFLQRMEYPTELSGFVAGNRLMLDHLLYDVGFDYRMEGPELVILKSGFYGFF